MHKAARRQLRTLGFLVAVALVALFFTRSRPPAPQGVAVKTSMLAVDVLIRTEQDTLWHGTLEAAGPMSALSALEHAASEATLPVGIRQYDFGKLVVSIGGHTSGSEGDWTYRVNDRLMPVAAEACQLAQGDRLEFRFGMAPDDTLPVPSDSTN